MATDPSTTPPADTARRDPDELIVYSRSNLFYWWPVWAFGFIFAIWSYLSDARMVIVPKESTLAKNSEGDWRVNVNFPEGTSDEVMRQYIERDTTEDEGTRKPNLHVSRQAWMGPIFCLIVLLTVIITNVPLRGLWSVVAIISILMIAILFALFEVWDSIFEALGQLHVYINMGGYLFLALVVFIVWALAFFLFDKRTYVRFKPGQVIVREEIGGREKTFDTIGMTSEKHRDDIFRHYVLGFGSGDLTVRPAGQEKEIVIPNVLFISSKLDKAQNMLARKPAGAGQT